MLAVLLNIRMNKTNLGVDADWLPALIALIRKDVLVAFDAVRLLISHDIPEIGFGQGFKFFSIFAFSLLNSQGTETIRSEKSFFDDSSFSNSSVVTVLHDLV